MKKVYQITLATRVGNSFNKYVEAKNIQQALGKAEKVLKKEQQGHSSKLEIDAVEFVCAISK